MNASHQSLNFQLGLLHFVHLLAMVDGVIDEREQKAIGNILGEEGVPQSVVHDFHRSVLRKTEKEIYRDGLDHLNQCNDDEKKCVFVHLYQLSEADDKIHIKEVRLLLYSLKATRIEFEDVELIARLTKATNDLVHRSDQNRAA